VKKFILAIDQGTSSTKTLVFDAEGTAIAKGNEPLQTNYLDNGFVEQDPEEILQNVLQSVRKCLKEFREKGYDENEIAGIGISNQRETFVVWDKEGKPLYPAIVWQCKRSVDICDHLIKQGLSETVKKKTGLVIDPYFSATKLIWLFQNNETVRKSIELGEARFGTIDTWLLYRLTGGKVYATDHTNASRTLFFNLHTMAWDEELINAYGLKGLRLPAIRPSSSQYGETNLEGIFQQAVSITAMIGDSHAAAFGEGCFSAGTAKATLGTGCSILMNTGNKPVVSGSGMVTTVCWSMEKRIDYALEGVIVSCGATIEWLKNQLGLFADSPATADMATNVSDNGGVYLVPAFSGLGSPHWQMERRASITGITFSTNKDHIVRAALESIPYQVKDVIAAMEKDAGLELKELMANGGITGNKFVMQFLADLLNKRVVTMGMPDVSALGAGYLAGLTVALYANMESISKLNASKNTWLPAPGNNVQVFYKGWQREISR
jgi:glycerol kinase